ncbi:MAG TPA: hypothetical protein VF885_15940 [Arthrobacter sp.]
MRPDEGSELGLISKTVRVVANGDQELARHFRSNTLKVAEQRGVGVENFLERGIGGGDFFREGLAASGQGF